MNLHPHKIVISRPSKLELAKCIEENVKRGVKPLHRVRSFMNRDQRIMYSITMGWEDGQARNDR